METTPKPGYKMKLTGYICIVFAIILTFFVTLGITEPDRIQATVSLISTWLMAGISLVTINAGKRLGGAAVQNMNQNK